MEFDLDPIIDGIHAMSCEDASSGIAAARQLAHDHPEDPRVYELLGDLLLSSSTEEALAAYQLAGELDATNLRVLGLRSRIFSIQTGR